LLGKGGEVATDSAVAGKSAVALYFSAHWCPPCRGFTPNLAEWYRKNLAEKGLEVVFVSSDKDEASFNEYFGEQPWLALPFHDREKKDALSKQFKVQGIPTVVVLGVDGSVITKDGKEAISQDPTGEEFPWKPKSFDEIFGGATLTGQGGDVKGSSLKGKVFGLYFSAHWCPPCRGFTPKLAEWYKKDLQAKDFEVVFVSSDKDEASFKDYFAEQPWLALDFGDRKRKEQLSNLFGVQGIPSFVIIDKDGSVITKDGRTAVTADPTGAEFPWYPKPVADLKNGPGSLNEVTTLMVFCETSDETTKKAIEDLLTPIAKEYLEKAKAAGEEDPEVAVMMATSAEGLSGRIREMVSLPSLPPAKHEHPLAKQEMSSGWYCDGCRCGSDGKERYRCTQGCDFDFCGECNAKAGESAPALAPKLVLLDIPDNGGFYSGPEGEISTDVVRKFLADHSAKALTRQQLG